MPTPCVPPGSIAAHQYRGARSAQTRDIRGKSPQAGSARRRGSAVRWSRHRDGVDFEIEIPPGRPAELRLPASTAGDIAVDGMPVEEHPRATLLGAGEAGARVSLSPGTWNVRCTSGSVLAATAGAS